MRIVLKYLILASLVLAMPVFAHAADKIGVVNVGEVMANSAAWKQATQSIQNKFTAKQQEFSRENDAIKQAKADLDKKAGVMNADAQKKEYGALQARWNKFLEDQNAAQQALNQEQHQALEPLMKRLEQVTADYAKKNGYSAIFVRDAVIFVGPGLDVTADITKAFDAAR